MFQNTNRHILSFDFFKSAVLSALLAVSFYIAYKEQRDYIHLLSFVVGCMMAYFPNIEGSQRHRIFGIVIGFFWSFFILTCQLLLFEASAWEQYAGMMLLVFISSMVAVYGLRGSAISFGSLWAIVMSYGLHAFNLPLLENLSYVLFGGFCYFIVAGISHFLYQNHHTQSVLADCAELTAEYLKSLEQQVWDEKDQETQLLEIESKLNLNHELLRSILLNRQGRLVSSNKTRRYYLIFREMIDLYETALAANHDLEHVREYFHESDAVLKPYAEFSKLLNEELEKLGENLRLNRDFKINPQLEIKLQEAEANLVNYLEREKSEENILILKNLIELKNKQLNTLVVISKHQQNIVLSDTIIPKRDRRFITHQDYSYKIFLANLNLDSAIFRHSLRLCAAITICFLLGNFLESKNTAWLIVTTIVVLRPNYGLTKSRAFNRVGGTILGAVITSLIAYFIDYKPALIAISAISLLLGFSYAAKKYFLASMYITLSVMLLYVYFTDRTVDILVVRIYFTAIGAAIALFSTYFIFPVWEKESIFTAIRNAIEANSVYLQAVNEIYKNKNAPDSDFRLVRKEAFVKNGNLYEAFQRLKDDPKSKRNQQSNSYAVVLLSHSMLKAIAAYSTYIQTHQTTQVSGEFKHIMKYILNQMELSSVFLENKKNIPIAFANPLESLERLDKYYFNLTRLQEIESESGVAQMTYETSLKLQEGKVILDQVKTIKSLAENTLEMCKLLATSPS